METLKLVPDNPYNEDFDIWSPGMTEILLTQLDNNYKTLEEKEGVLYQNTKPGPRPPSAPPGGGDKTIHKGGSTTKGT